MVPDHAIENLLYLLQHDFFSLLCRLPPAPTGTTNTATNAAIRYQPPPVGIRLPAPQIEIGSLKRAFSPPAAQDSRAAGAFLQSSDMTGRVMMTKRHIQFVRKGRLTDRHPSPQLRRPAGDTGEMAAPHQLTAASYSTDTFLVRGVGGGARSSVAAAASSSSSKTLVRLEREQHPVRGRVIQEQLFEKNSGAAGDGSSSSGESSSPSSSVRLGGGHALRSGGSPKRARRSSSVPSPRISEKSPRVESRSDIKSPRSDDSRDMVQNLLVLSDDHEHPPREFVEEQLLSREGGRQLLPREGPLVVQQDGAAGAVIVDTEVAKAPDEDILEESILLLLPEEIVLITCEFLDSKSQFELCVA